MQLCCRPKYVPKEEPQEEFASWWCPGFLDKCSEIGKDVTSKLDVISRPCRVLSWAFKNPSYLVILFKGSSLCNLSLQLHGSRQERRTTNASMNYLLVIACQCALDEPNLASPSSGWQPIHFPCCSSWGKEVRVRRVHGSTSLGESCSTSTPRSKHILTLCKKL